MLKRWLWRTLLVAGLGLPLGHQAFGLESALWKGVTDATLALVEGAAPRGLSSGSTTVESAGRIEVGFSPGGSAQALILKTIGSARSSIDVLAYAFTSPEITRALVQASKNGVRVRVVADHNHNMRSGEGAGTSRGRAALNTLVNAGAEVFTTDSYAIHHDKVLIVDARHVQTGSFNYSSSAASRNSENVLVVWDNPELAGAYARHFARNLSSARKLQSY